MGRWWTGSRNGASNGVMGECLGFESSREPSRRALSRGGMIVVCGVKKLAAALVVVMVVLL